MIEIAASAVVPASPERVHAFLTEGHNHWQLAGPQIELLEIGESDEGELSGTVQVRGPLGLTRRARTKVLRATEPRVLAGTAEIGGKTRAEVRWDLEPATAGAQVTLSARVLSASPGDRLLLLVGGRIWMRHVFARTLRLLAERLLAEDRLAALEAA